MKKIIVVDGRSTGKIFVKKLLNLGYQIIHVRTFKDIPIGFKKTYDPSLFIAEYIYDGSVDDLLNEVNKHNAELVIAGSETGVELADLLSEKMNLLTNGTQMSAARRNKFLMSQALVSYGIDSAKQFKSDNVQKIIEWVTTNSRFPVVLKPINSAGADSVTICNSLEMVESAFYNIIGKINQIGILNREVLVQEFLSGVEYIVNTVSRDGHNIVCDIWKCQKKLIAGSGYISCVEELMTEESAITKSLSDYAIHVLNALQISNGPAHLEIMMTERGPVLIEVGARFQGWIHPDSITKATGTNQIDLAIEAYLDPKTFKEKSSKYKKKLYMYHTFMLSLKTGTIKNIHGLDEIKNLESFSEMTFGLKIGDNVKKTVDLYSTIGVVDFINHSLDSLLRDYNCFRSIEHDQLLEVEL